MFRDVLPQQVRQGPVPALLTQHTLGLVLETPSLPWCAPHGRNGHLSCSGHGEVLKSVLHEHSQPKLFACEFSVLSRGHFHFSAAPCEGFIPSHPVCCSGNGNSLPALSETEVDSALTIPEFPFWLCLLPAAHLGGSGVLLPPFPLAHGVSWDVALENIYVENKTEWDENRSFVRTLLKHGHTVKSCGSFPSQPGVYISLTPQATQLHSHLIIQRLAALLPMAFLEMSWLFSFPWGLVLCRMLIFSKLCWLITAFLSILFLKCPLHSPEQPGHQAGEWNLEGTTV